VDSGGVPLKPDIALYWRTSFRGIGTSVLEEVDRLLRVEGGLSN
jgi:hypothetical protein